MAFLLKRRDGRDIAKKRYCPVQNGTYGQPIPRTHIACAPSFDTFIPIGHELLAFYLVNKLRFRLYLASIGGIFLKFRTFHTPSMRYERCKFGCNLPKRKVTLLRHQNSFSSISRLPFKGGNWDFIARTVRHALRTLEVWLKCVCSEGHCTGRQIDLSSVYRLPSERWNWCFIPLTVCAWTTNRASLVQIGQ